MFNKINNYERSYKEVKKAILAAMAMTHHKFRPDNKASLN